jgi:hypothetical protein
MSVNPNQTNVTAGDALFNPATASGIFSWPNGASLTAAVTVPGVSATSVIMATVSVDDQQGSGICWIISSTPSANTITFTVAAAPTTPNSSLRIDWLVAKY